MKFRFSFSIAKGDASLNLGMDFCAIEHLLGHSKSGVSL